MRAILVCIIPGSLSACAILDPVPYSPTGTLAATNQDDTTSTSANAVDLIAFKDYPTASRQLRHAASQYEDERNLIMRQRLIFDIPLIGLSAAAIVNGLFVGANDTTVGLGLSAAGVGGASLYFNPQVRISAYHGASLTLRCYADVADAMYGTESSKSELTKNEYLLSAAVARATVLLLAGEIPNQQGSALLAARDAGTAALIEIRKALALYGQGPLKIQAFARTTVDSATTKIVEGVQNVSAVIKLIQDTATPQSSEEQQAISPAVEKDKAYNNVVPSNMDVTEIISLINDIVGKVAPHVSNINNAWATRLDCLPKAAL